MRISDLIKTAFSVGIPFGTKDAQSNPVGLTIGPTAIPLYDATTTGSLKLLPEPGSGTQTQGANGVIFNTQLPALSSFSAVRLWYLNYDQTAVQTWDGAYVASAPTSLAGNNSALTGWTQVKVNGATSWSVPQAVLGAGAQVIPGIVLTDPVFIRSIARTDTGGAPPLLRVVSHESQTSGTSTHPIYNGTGYAAINAASFNPGLINGTYVFPGALAGMTGVGATVLNSGGVQNPIGAVFYYDKQVYDCVMVGDSLMQGTGGTSYCGFSEYLTFASYSNPVQWSGANFSTAGQLTVDTVARLKAVIPQFKPRFAIFRPWSPNDPNTQAGFDTSWGYTLEMIDYCRRNGVIPIVYYAPFCEGYSNTLITAQNARVAALPSYVRRLDIYSILTPGGVWVSAYRFDGTHPTDAGRAAVAAAHIAQITY